MHQLMRFPQSVVAALLVIGFATGQADADSFGMDDVLVAEQSGGTVRHYSASGADLGAVASGLSLPSWMAMESGNLDNTGSIRNGFVRGENLDLGVFELAGEAA